MLKVNQLTGFWYAPADFDFLGGAALVLGEPNAMGIDFTYHTDINKQVKIRGTGSYYGSAYGKLTYTSPAIKLCRQSDGVWRYGSHNLYLNSAAPADQSITVVSGGTYAIVITGSVSITLSGATTGTVTAGTTNFTAATTTLTGGSTSGSGTVTVYRTPSVGNYLATTGSAVYDLPYEWNAALASQGILIEEQRANITRQSQALSTAPWTSVAGGMTRTNNAGTAPDGTTTATICTPNATTNKFMVYNNSDFINGTTTTMSVFAKPNGYTELAFRESGVTGASVIFTLTGPGTVKGTHTAGATITSSITAEANGWYRCVATFVFGGAINQAIGLLIMDGGWVSGDPFSYTYSANGTSGIYLWGAQFEASTFPTSPIHTIGGTVTRAVDNISLATSSYPHSATVGTAIVNATKVGALDASVSCLTINDGTDSERFQFFSSNGSGNGSTRFFVADGGASQFPTNPIDANVIVLGTPFKLGAAWAANDLAAVHNGGTVATSGTATLPTVTTMRFANAAAGDQGTSHYVRQVTYLARRATNVELQTRTT